MCLSAKLLLLNGDWVRKMPAQRVPLRSQSVGNLCSIRASYGTSTADAFSTATVASGSCLVVLHCANAAIQSYPHDIHLYAIFVDAKCYHCCSLNLNCMILCQEEMAYCQRRCTKAVIVVPLRPWLNCARGTVIVLLNPHVLKLIQVSIVNFTLASPSDDFGAFCMAETWCAKCTCHASAAISMHHPVSSFRGLPFPFPPTPHQTKWTCCHGASVCLCMRQLI